MYATSVSSNVTVPGATEKVKGPEIERRFKIPVHVNIPGVTCEWINFPRIVRTLASVSKNNELKLTLAADVDPGVYQKADPLISLRMDLIASFSSLSVNNILSPP